MRSLLINNKGYKKLKIRGHFQSNWVEGFVPGGHTYPSIHTDESFNDVIPLIPQTRPKILQLK